MEGLLSTGPTPSSFKLCRRVKLKATSKFSLISMQSKLSYYFTFCISMIYWLSATISIQLQSQKSLGSWFKYISLLLNKYILFFQIIFFPLRITQTPRAKKKSGKKKLDQETWLCRTHLDDF